MNYRVYFKDGNQRIFEADGLFDLISYICYELWYQQDDVYKIEEVEV